MNCDIVPLLPLGIVGIGALLLMLLAAFEKIHLEVAAVFSMGIFILAFVMQLLPAGPDDLAPYTTIFHGMLVTNAFTKVAALIILACGFFTAMSSTHIFARTPSAPWNFTV